MASRDICWPSRNFLKRFALAVPHDSALEIRDEVGFFQEVRRCWQKASAKEAANRRTIGFGSPANCFARHFLGQGHRHLRRRWIEEAGHFDSVRRILARGSTPAATQLAVELLQKLLNNELKIRSKKYLVQSRSFAEMLEATIRKYQNRTIEAAQVIAELIELAKQMRKARSAAKSLD